MISVGMSFILSIISELHLAQLIYSFAAIFEENIPSTRAKKTLHFTQKAISHSRFSKLGKIYIFVQYLLSFSKVEEFFSIWKQNENCLVTSESLKHH